MMYYSKYNIFSQIRNSSNYFIVNLLSGNADIINPEEADKLNYIRKSGTINESNFTNDLIVKGYLIDEKVEASNYRNKYLDFIDSREKDEIQVFFIPNYSCNFACSYCYQDEYNNLPVSITNELIDSFFNYIKKELPNRKKYITIFGGEPLLNSPKHKEIIRYLLDQSNKSNLEVCIVTNGYLLKEYLDILLIGRIREIQVTLDGTASVHNSRRYLKGGSPTFEKIVEGIDACLDNKLNVNLRMVIDKENIENLVELAQFAINKGWTKSRYFKTQIGRNYELHHCQSAPDKLFSRISLYEKLYELIRVHPFILEFYKPAFSISRFISENESLPDPLFDSCPACKTEWAFDYTGHIYPCTATVGKKDESLGTFHPEAILNNKMINNWETRDVMTIPECKDCSIQLACGGGCGSVAKNKTGNICSPDCRPVRELLELGFSAYIE